MKTILIVDNDRALQDLLKSTLEEHHAVLCASKGKEALALCEDNAIDLLLIDGALVDMGGLDCVALLRQRGHSMEVFFMSTFSFFVRDPKTVLLLEQLEVTEVLQKPLELSELLVRIAQALHPEQDDAALLSEEQAIRDLDTFAQMKHKYLIKVHQRLHEIQAHFVEAREADSPFEALQKVLFLAHQLYGSAGTFGFSDISALFRRLEQHIAKIVDQQNPPSKADWKIFERLLQRAFENIIHRAPVPSHSGLQAAPRETE